jgi:hypothetical protein
LSVLEPDVVRRNRRSASDAATLSQHGKIHPQTGQEDSGQGIAAGCSFVVGDGDY